MPSQLQIISANHLETLVGGLAEVVKRIPGQQGADPMVPETIVVQSKGMQRWISMAIARRNGICANFDFPFPNAFLEATYANVIGPLPENDYFHPQTMTFRIMALLDDLRDHPTFAPLRRYLSSGSSAMKHYQLAGRIADVFDQYLVFRPDIISTWESRQDSQIQDDAAWQRLLWRKLRGRTDELHRADLQIRLIRRLKDTGREVTSLPPRISVFGISYLPLFHLQVLDALAHRVPVHLFLLNPCRHYWADIVSERHMARVKLRQPSASPDPSTLYLERGNRLLASWGHQGRQFFSLTQQMEGDIIDLFDDNPTGTLLGAIQQDILDLRDRTEDEDAAGSMKADESLEIHVCHSPMREVEVLHDRLLGILDSHPEIMPGDILVMTPDIGRYAPYIHAVFGKAPGTDTPSIPFTVADQSVPRESRVADAFLRVLDLIDGRFEASLILRLLEYASIRRRFGIQTGDLPQIEQWVQESNIRWGWDGAHRKKHGLPRFTENTWRMGLDRLLMGYAMSSGPDDTFAGISPHAGVEGSDSTILGAFIHFCESLHHLLDRIPERTGLRRWRNVFDTMLEALFEPNDESIRDIQMLRGIFAQLERIEQHVEGPDSIPFEVIRQFLSDHLNRTSYGTGFLGGGVTFCAMLPMRSIPAKIICLLGMQHDSFPQDLREPGFNLIATEPRAGDRSKRDDDKYLFLEALLSARTLFYISYVGRDIQDNSPKPPSVLVNELLDYVGEDLGVGEDKLVIEHPLQAYSSSYFDSSHPELFSYSEENREASRQLHARENVSPFFNEPLPEPPADWRFCELDQICRFFAHPVRTIMERRLGIRFWEASTVVSDIETFNLTPLDRFKVSQDMYAGHRDGRDPADHFQALQASGQLPHGNVGAVVYDDLHREVNTFSRSVEQLVPQDVSPIQIPIEIDLPPFRITGELPSVYPDAMVIHRLAKSRPSDVISAFIRHLMLNLSQRDDKPGRTLLICKDTTWEFGRVADPQSILMTYLNLYWQGLQFPLPFFSRTSFAYAFQKIVKGKSEGEAMKEALKAWHGGYYLAGDSADAYHRKCFSDSDLFGDSFAPTAIAVYEPVFAAGRQMPTGS